MTQFKKNNSGELENYSRQNCPAETLSKDKIPALYPSLDIRVTFWSGSEINLSKWTKEQQN